MKKTKINTGSMEDILSSVLAIMRHVKEVQVEILTLNQQSSDAFIRHLQLKDDVLSDEVLNGMQFQDIITQQLNAIVEAITSVEKSVTIHLRAAHEDNEILHESFFKLHNKMLSSLEEAKKKKEAVGGYALVEESQDELEFF